MPDVELDGIAQKMVAVMQAIDGIEKLGQAEEYKFVRAADVARTVRVELIAVGIAFEYDVIETQRWESKSSGALLNYCQVTVEVKFTDSTNGDSMGGRVVGWGSSANDKAVYKAMTGALKYGLRMAFMIPDELDPESQPEPEHRSQEVELVTDSDRRNIAGGLRKYGIPLEEFDAWRKASCHYETTAEMPKSMLSAVYNWIETNGQRNAMKIAEQSMVAMEFNQERRDRLLEKCKGNWTMVNEELEKISREEAASKPTAPAAVYNPPNLTVLITKVAEIEKDNKTYMVITFGTEVDGKTTATCWHKSRFSCLRNATDQVCHLLVTLAKGYLTVDDVLQVGDQEYREGKIYPPMTKVEATTTVASYPCAGCEGRGNFDGIPCETCGGSGVASS